LLRETGRDREAQALLDRASERASEWHRHMEIADAHWKLPKIREQIDQQRRQAERDFKLSPWGQEFQKAIQAKHSKEFKGVVEHSQKALILMEKSGKLKFSNPAVQWMFNIAQKARATQQYETAENMYAVLMKYGPDRERGTIACLDTLASISLNARNYVKAESYYRQRISDTTRDRPQWADKVLAKLYANLALCFECQERFAEAEAIYTENVHNMLANAPSTRSIYDYDDPRSFVLLSYAAFLNKHNRSGESAQVLKQLKELFVEKHLRFESKRLQDSARYEMEHGAMIESARHSEMADLLRSLEKNLPN
jgi:hypothetical protein